MKNEMTLTPKLVKKLWIAFIFLIVLIAFPKIEFLIKFNFQLIYCMLGNQLDQATVTDPNQIQIDTT